VIRHSTNSAPRAPSGTQAIERAFAILRSFSDSRREWTLAELSRSLVLTKPTALRLLGVLEREGMVRRSGPGGTYRLGPTAIEFGALAQRTTDLAGVARPELERLAERTGETASLEVLAGPQIQVLDQVRGPSRGSAAEYVGARWPAHAAATGKVMLAAAHAADSDLWHDYVAVMGSRLPRFTDRTIASMPRLITALTVVERQGFATAIEELNVGYAAIAAPIRDHNGTVVAAICLGGPLTRIARRRLRILTRQVMEACGSVSRSLGSAAGLRGHEPLLRLRA
jgi:DNA-binding IclR family transcriptional regulator